MCGHCVSVCREFENFQSYPVHVLGGVLCGDFINFQCCFVYGLCVVVCGDFDFFKKSTGTVTDLVVLYCAGTNNR